MTGVFISYRQNRRRPDGEAELCGQAQLVEAIAELLARHFGSDRVLLDTSLRIASRYPDELRARLDRCDVVLAVIHREWLTDLNDRLARLKPGDKDWVHFEIKTALSTGTPIAPLLLDGATMPSRQNMPSDIAEFAMAQAHRLRFGQLPTDLAGLQHAIERHVSPEPVPAATARTATRAKRPRPWAEPRIFAAIALFAPLLVTLALVDGPMARAAWLAAVAIVVLIYQTTAFLLAAAVYLLRKPFDAISRDSAEVPPNDKSNVIIGTTMVAVGIFTLWTGDLLPREGSMLVMAMIAMVAVTFGPKWLASRHSTERWPLATISATPSGIRSALAQLRRHLDSCRPPLSRLEYDQASFAITQITRATVELGEQCEAGRRAWLRRAPRWLVLLQITTSATAIGSIPAALYSHWLSGGRLWPAWAAAVGGILAVCGLHLGTAELPYRVQRWRCRLVAASAAPERDRLAKRLLEISIPPRGSEVAGHPPKQSTPAAGSSGARSGGAASGLVTRERFRS